MAQNLMSVAGELSICARAAAAADSSALGAAAAVGVLEETALSCPACTVDFSAWVAAMVRR